MDKKYLIEKKDSLLSKIINYIKRKFGFNRELLKEENETIENKRNDFIKDIKDEEQEDYQILTLQQMFENGIIELSSMSYDEVRELNSLYKRQNSKLSKILDNKKTQLNMLKYELSGNI